MDELAYVRWPGTRMVLGRRAFENEHELTRVVIHELAHVHAGKRWSRASFALEEGMAHAVACILMGEPFYFAGAPPTVDEYLEVMAFSSMRDCNARNTDKLGKLVVSAAQLAYLILRDSTATQFDELEWRTKLAQVPLIETPEPGHAFYRPKMAPGFP